MTASPARSALARAAAVAAALPVAAGLLLTAATPAAAAVRQPADGAVFDDYRTVDITADYGTSAGATERLLLTSPGGVETEVKAQRGGLSGGTLAYALDLACWTADCRRAPNGTWTVRQTGSTTDTGTFVTRIAPVAPTGVEATALSPTEAKVSWRVGPEPDLVGWDVYDGGAKAAGVAPGSCAAGVCSAVISYAAAGSGDHAYTVRALRSTGPGATSTLESPGSASASVRLESAPGPAPTGAAGSPDSPGAPGEGGQPGSGGASGAPSSAAGGGSSAPSGTGSRPRGATADEKALQQRKAFAVGFSTFGPKLGIPKLPPLPKNDRPAVAPELADGAFEPTLGFQDQVLTERVDAQGTTGRMRDVVGSALDSERLATSTAGALVLLLAGAHLRRWLGSSVEE